MPITWPGNWLAIFRHCDGGEKTGCIESPIDAIFRQVFRTALPVCNNGVSARVYEGKSKRFIIWVWYGSTLGVDDRELHIHTYQIGGLEHVLFATSETHASAPFAPALFMFPYIGTNNPN